MPGTPRSRDPTLGKEKAVQDAGLKDYVHNRPASVIDADLNANNSVSDWANVLEKARLVLFTKDLTGARERL